ncbi:MAG: hypothetical protein PVI70_15570 [Gammaproteobacteria bacterium]|jgi:hypothetical protein
MKTIGKFLIAAVALLLILALIPALIPDEQYSRGAKEWLVIAHAPATVPSGENRFHAQVGFLAPADADMVEYGAGLVRGANEVLEGNGSDFDPAWQDPPLGSSPALSDLRFDAVIEDPLAWLADNRALLQRLVDENALLLERYGRLTQMSGYDMTLTPDYRAPIPDYSSLNNIHRLDSLAIAATIVDDADNLPRLREAIDKQRFALADAATLIEKMVDIAMLHFDIRLYAELLKLPGVAERHEPFTALDAEERTLEKAYVTEFASASSLLDGDLPEESSSWFENLLIGLYLKPRKLENHAFEYTWMHLLALESRPLGERSYPEAGSTYGWWERYTDPIGYILYRISRPTFTYHDRIEHLDGLITLVDCAAEIHRRSLQGEDIAAYLSSVDAGAHPGYAGAILGFDADNQELYIQLPGYDASAGAHPLDRPPRLALD